MKVQSALHLFVLLAFPLASKAQQPIHSKYFDSTWSVTEKDKAYFVQDLYQRDNHFEKISRRLSDGGLVQKVGIADTATNQRFGTSISYFEDGRTEDSANYYPGGELKDAYRYYQDGKLFGRYTYNNRTKKEKQEGFNQNGTPIPDFIYGREADYPDGIEAWQNFLAETLNSKVPVRKKAPVGSYQVMVQFIIDETGKVTDVKPLTNYGYGMEEEATRVVRRSARWMPAIDCNRPVKAYRKQPITFVVEER